MVTRVPSPDAVVDGHGQVRFGVFDSPLRRINLGDARIRKGGVTLPKALARMRLKQWQHFCLDLPGVFASFAIVDSAYLRLSWCHVVERPGGRHFEHGRKGPLLDTRIASELWSDRTWVRAPGYRITVDNALEEGEHRIELAIDEAPGLPAVRGALRCIHDLSKVQPLVVVLPVGPNRGMYSHKVALPLEGELTVGPRTYRASAGEGHAILDVHKAHYPHHTFWSWATFAGRDPAGRLVALNLTRNVNRDDERYNENGVWVDGALHHLGPARFDYDPRDLMRPFTLGTRDGAVELTFTGEGERAETIDVGVIRSAFHQPYGTFRGRVRLPSGEVLPIEDLFGVVEDHDARW